MPRIIAAIIIGAAISYMADSMNKRLDQLITQIDERAQTLEQQVTELETALGITE